MSETQENPIDNQREFENIQAPEELLAFMNERLQYGFVGKNKQIYTPNDATREADRATQYYLQSPEELLTSGYGECWDTVELERRWFSEHGYQPETYFMMYAKPGGTDLPTHTFLVFEKAGKWYWFEQAFADQQGIHEYASREELIDDVKKKHHEYAVQHREATAGDLARLRVATYTQPNYGSNPQEFVADIIEQQPQLISESD